MSWLNKYLFKIFGKFLENCYHIYEQVPSLNYSIVCHPVSEWLGIICTLYAYIVIQYVAWCIRREHPLSKCDTIKFIPKLTPILFYLMSCIFNEKVVYLCIYMDSWQSYTVYGNRHYFPNLIKILLKKWKRTFKNFQKTFSVLQNMVLRDTVLLLIWNLQHCNFISDAYSSYIIEKCVS